MKEELLRWVILEERAVREKDLLRYLGEGTGGLCLRNIVDSK